MWPVTLYDISGGFGKLGGGEGEIPLTPAFSRPFGEGGLFAEEVGEGERDAPGHAPLATSSAQDRQTGVAVF